MRWANDWRLYYVAAALFIIAGSIAWLNDGLGLRPLFGFVMGAGMALIGHKAKREAGLPPS